MWPCDECPLLTSTFIQTSNYVNILDNTKKQPAVLLCGISGSGRKATARHVIRKKWVENSRWHELIVPSSLDAHNLLTNILTQYGIGTVLRSDLSLGYQLLETFRLLENNQGTCNKFFILDLSKLDHEPVAEILLSLNRFCGELSTEARTRWTILVPVTLERQCNYEHDYPNIVCHRFAEFNTDEIRSLIQKRFPHIESLQALADEIKESHWLQQSAHPSLLCLIVRQLDAKDPNESVEQFLNGFFSTPEQTQTSAPSMESKSYSSRVQQFSATVLGRIIEKDPDYKDHHKRVIKMMSFVHQSNIPFDLLHAFLFTHLDQYQDTTERCLRILLVELQKAGMIKGSGEDQPPPQSPYTTRTIVQHSMKVLRKGQPPKFQIELLIDAMVGLVTVMSKKGHMLDYQSNKSYIAHGTALLDNVDELVWDATLDEKLGLKLLCSHLACRIALAKMVDSATSDWEQYLRENALDPFVLAVHFEAQSRRLKMGSSEEVIAVYQKCLTPEILRSRTLRRIAERISRNHYFGAKSQRPLSPRDAKFKKGILTKKEHENRLQRGEILYKSDRHRQQKFVDSELLLKVMVGEWLVEIFTTWSLGQYLVQGDKKARYLQKARIAYDLCVEIYEKHKVCILPALTTFQTLLHAELTEASSIQDVQRWQALWDGLASSAAPQRLPGSAPASQVTSASSSTSAAARPSQGHTQPQRAAGPSPSAGASSLRPHAAQPGTSMATGGRMTGIGSNAGNAQPQGAANFSFSPSSFPQDSAIPDTSAASPITDLGPSLDRGSSHLDGSSRLFQSSSMDATGSNLPLVGELDISQKPPASSASPAPPPLPPRNRQANSTQPPTQPPTWTPTQPPTQPPAQPPAQSITVPQSASDRIDREREVYEEGHHKFSLYDDQDHKLRDMKMQLLIRGALCRLDPNNSQYQEGFALIEKIKQFIKDHYSGKETHAAMCKAYRGFAEFYGELDDPLDALKMVIKAFDCLRKYSDMRLDPNSFQFQRLIDDLRMFLDKYKGKYGSVPFLMPSDIELGLLEEMRKGMRPLRGYRQADEGPHAKLLDDVIDHFVQRERSAQATEM